MKIKVGRLPHHRSNRPKAYPLSVIYNEIRTGKTTIGRNGMNIKGYTERARAYRATDTDAYKKMKVYAPAFCPAGTLDASRQIVQPSGYLLIEFDNLGSDASVLQWQISEEPATTTVFRTMSGEGIAAIVTLAHVPEDALQHRHAWLAAADYYSHIAEADVSDAKQNQLRALCHDPDIYVNPDSMPLDWEINTEGYQKTFPVNMQFTAVTGPDSLTEEYFDAIRSTGWLKNGWSVDAVPCPMEEHSNDGWSLDSNRCHVRCLDDTPGYLFHCFKCGQKMRWTYPPKEY